MSEKTIEQIRGEYRAEAVRLQNDRSARVDAIAALRRPEGDAYYLDRLDDAQRNQLLMEQKAALADEDRRQLQTEFRAVHETYAKELSERTAFLNRRLFGVEGPESASLLARAALASEDELSSLLDIAAQSGNAELGRVAFLTAHRRGLGDLMARYFAEVDPEAQPLYHEVNGAPAPETVQHQLENIDAMIPPASADQLAARPALPFERLVIAELQED